MSGARSPALPRSLALLAALLLLAGCGDEPERPALLPRVKVLQVQTGEYAASASLTGDIQARVQTQLSFRVGGKIIERRADVGDHVQADQVLARLDPQDLRNNLSAAEAAAEAERMRLKQAEANLYRQQVLLPKGYTSRSEYDAALANQRSAKNSLAAAEAQLANAREQVGYTELRAEADGIITERQAEVGQVVQATAPIFSLARDGQRDAVFNVYEALLAAPAGQLLEIVLLDDPSVKTRGRVREITPTVSEQSGTLQVKVELEQVPEQMRLGSTIGTQVQTRASHSIELPWSALTIFRKQPAVWRLDGDDKASLQPVQIGRYLTGKVILSGGLENGERVVVAGAQLLHPGQQVEIASSASEAQP